jgi:hypothetical protein
VQRVSKVPQAQLDFKEMKVLLGQVEFKVALEAREFKAQQD